MILVAAIVAAVLWIPSPWSWIVVAAAGVVEIGETMFWYWYTNRRRATVGAETLLGRSAEVVLPCYPDGQVRLDGELWQARCDEGAARGGRVVVTGRDGLVLLVRPSDD